MNIHNDIYNIIIANTCINIYNNLKNIINNESCSCKNLVELNNTISPDNLFGISEEDKRDITTILFEVLFNHIIKNQYIITNDIYNEINIVKIIHIMLDNY